MKFFFSNQTLDTDTRELSRENMPVSLEPQVFDLVVHLMENRDRVVSKDELIEKIWKGRHVAESTLTSRINAARKAVGDSGSAQAMIRTVARKGFRFVGAVQTGGDAAPAAAGALRHDDASQPIVPLGDRPGIAVLPFINMSGDRDQDYFSDGISEDIITALSKLRWFFVIARNSSFTYKGRCVHLNEMARELGVRYVVEGSVRRSGERVRISAQLNDVSTGSHLWAERYDRDLADVFAVQDEITEAIVAAVEPHLYAAESFRAQRKPPGSLDAWDLVMRALSHYWAGGWACGRPAASSAPIWAGPAWPMRWRMPPARRRRRSRPTAKTRGRIMAWLIPICSRESSTMPSPNSNWRCG